MVLYYVVLGGYLDLTGFWDSGKGVDGKEYDIKNFFQSISDNYFKHLTDNAKIVLFKNAEVTISSLHSTLYEIESKLNSINDDLSYDINYLERKIKMSDNKKWRLQFLPTLKDGVSLQS